VDGGFRDRAGFGDGLQRATVGVYVRVTRNQLWVLQERAAAAGKPLKQYLRELWEDEINRTIPLVAEGPHQG
jgi:hypothetical protein